MIDKLSYIEKICNLFFKYGIRNITTDFIAKEIGISKKTLYEAFHSKEQIVEEAINFIINKQEFHKTYNDLNINYENLNAIDQILIVIKNLAELNQKINPIFFIELEKYFPHLFSKFIKFKKELLRNKIIENLKKGKKEDLYRKEINEEIISVLYLSFIEKINPNNFTEYFGTKYSFQEVIREIYLFHLYAIVNNKGKKYLESKINDL
ncbi:MAG: TetR/AcrR family transcriptional regulator [Bacteroidales bacterium]|nr:TetR/AcrR family transcriptional regulator [Bacteroidales bacterium]